LTAPFFKQDWDCFFIPRSPPYKTAPIILPILAQFSQENTVLGIRLAHPVILLPNSLRIVIADGMSPFSPTSQQTNKAIKTIQLQAFNIKQHKKQII